MSSLSPLTTILLLVAIGLAPYAAVMITSYTKIVVVISLIRNALGVQNIPPNTVVNGLALILSLFIMYPVLNKSTDILEKTDISTVPFAQQKATLILAAEPFRQFMLKHAKPEERRFFAGMAKQIWPPEEAATVKDDDLFILMPAFTVGELRSAFEIGFLLYLPFVAIDLIISNILLAMGMMMLSPTTISLPFKLLLFVLVDGWGRLLHGLVLSYS